MCALVLQCTHQSCALPVFSLASNRSPIGADSYFVQSEPVSRLRHFTRLDLREVSAVNCGGAGPSIGTVCLPATMVDRAAHYMPAWNMRNVFHSFAARQFEYHSVLPDVVALGTITGQLLVGDPVRDHVFATAAASSERASARVASGRIMLARPLTALRASCPRQRAGLVLAPPRPHALHGYNFQGLCEAVALGQHGESG